MVDIIDAGQNFRAHRVRIKGRAVDTAIKAGRGATIKECDIETALVGINLTGSVSPLNYQTQLIEGNKLQGCYTGISVDEINTKIHNNNLYASTSGQVAAIVVTGDRPIITNNVLWEDNGTATFPVGIHLDDVEDFIIDGNVIRHTEN